jgi:hypothetical protein
MFQLPKFEEPTKVYHFIDFFLVFIMSKLLVIALKEVVLKELNDFMCETALSSKNHVLKNLHTLKILVVQNVEVICWRYGAIVEPASWKLRYKR